MNQKNLSVKLLLLSFMLLAIVFSQSTLAQTRSRILGVVKDSQSKETLVGVTVMVKGTNLGAATDLDGKFIIINV
ncbi:MAG: carboxypeptidase-like regulatory domain-containing protein, partial [Ignavibacteria bacterium]|nr:carboxypeptidase-like regulatory domain-containing protein [Ignavibacteria bacterium]